MDNQKIKSLMSNKEFVKKIASMQTPEEVQAAFKEQGVEISIEKINALGTLIDESLKGGNIPLNEQELEKIVGGAHIVFDEDEDPRKFFAMANVVATAVVGLATLGGMATGWWAHKRYVEQQKKQKNK